MKVHVITDAEGIIKAFQLRKHGYDPRIHGSISPTQGDTGHDIEVFSEHRLLLEEEPHMVSATLRVDLSGREPRFSRR